MNNTAYWDIIDNNHYIQGLSLIALAQEYGTPLYVYDANYIHQQLLRYKNHPRNPHIHYAVKANSNLSLLARFHHWGAGFDIVSQGELLRVLQVGGSVYKIVFSGVAKTDAEIMYAIQHNIGRINVESEIELKRITTIANNLNKNVRISLRVNPNIDAQTHPYISTGMKDNKFGIALEEATALYYFANCQSNLIVDGISCHIGSQITTLSPFLAAFDNILSLAHNLRSANIHISHLDIGGGLGIPVVNTPDVPSPDELIQALYQNMGEENYTLHLEPGRSLVGNSAILLTRVIGSKTQSGKNFVMVDAAMNDYIRPALYQSQPAIRNLSSSSSLGKNLTVDIVGPICESSDIFAKSIQLDAEIGNILAFAGVGAYGMSMSSQYNSRLRPAELLVENGKAKLIRQRDHYTQLWENEIII